jgi:hypothetical protein
MTPTPRPNGTPPFVVELTEWDQVGPARDSRLKGRSLASDMQSRRLAETLRERLDIREGYEGLEMLQCWERTKLEQWSFRCRS